MSALGKEKKLLFWREKRQIQVELQLQTLSLTIRAEGLLLFLFHCRYKEVVAPFDCALGFEKGSDRLGRSIYQRATVLFGDGWKQLTQFRSCCCWPFCNITTTDAVQGVAYYGDNAD